MPAVGSQQSVIPPGLPKLPGNGFKDPTAVHYAKTHVFDVQNGIPAMKSTGSIIPPSPPPRRGGAVLMQPATAFAGANALSPTKTQPAQGSEAATPAWIAFDRKVLRFNCHFDEEVHDSQAEASRVRKCILYYYLEDDSMHICEPKVENSGLGIDPTKSAVYLKRHRVPKPEGDFFGATDLNIGLTIDIYGRVFTLTDCDGFTRTFLEKLGIEVPQAIEEPTDGYTSTRAAVKAHVGGRPRPVNDALIRGVEASLGASSHLLEGDRLGQFLDNDRKVLRFYMAWDDRKKLYGELRPFILHYYLADDHMEVVEVKTRNNGRDPFPLFVKKGKVYKNIDSYTSIDSPTTHTTQNIGRSGRVDPATMEAFTEADFGIGKSIKVLGVEFFIHACDEFTRDYYQKVHGVELVDVPFVYEEKWERPKMPVPPHTGWAAIGSEEDSLNSMQHLVPKPPKKDMKKLMDKDGVILRFLARFETEAEEDTGRQFVIKFYCANDTIAVFEPPLKNSGLVGGKFIERTTLRKAGTQKEDGTWEFWLQGDFYTGAVVELNGWRFVIYQADEYTLSYMEAHPEQHPMSSIAYICEQAAPVLAEKREALLADFAAADRSESGYVNYEPFQAALAGAGMELNDQVLVTLLRRFDVRKDGTVSYRELMNPDSNLWK